MALVFSKVMFQVCQDIVGKRSLIDFVFREEIIVAMLVMRDVHAVGEIRFIIFEVVARVYVTGY